MAFKIVDDEYGQLTFTRIYQGKVEKGGSYFNQRTGKKDRFSRIVKMHADKREEIDSASAGDIVAIMGIDCASGDTYCSEPKFCTLESMHIAKPVIKMSIQPLSRDNADRLSKALQRFRKEDPTFQVMTDEETGETVIAGMGELHLEIYVERIRREYRVEVEVGPPKVSYRESATKPVAYDFTHKKQTGGSGQYAHIVGQMAPMTDEEAATTEGELLFVDNVVGGRIPKNFIPAIEKGFRNMLVKGPVAGFPVVGIKIDLNDGKHHEVDSSDMAFMVCAQNCFRETFPKMKPALLEPIMLMELEVPEKFQGTVVGNISARRGIVLSTDLVGGITKIMAEVPLAETFGYSTDLRSMTQGQGTFTMELSKYRPVPSSIQADVIAERKAELQPA
jgi:elongation factor G